MNLFANSTRPNHALFFSRHNPNDQRMGDVVRFQQADYAEADYVILGCPQDEGVQRNGGRIGAAHAPQAIRDRFYRLVGMEQLKLFDLGDTILQPNLEATHQQHQALVSQLISDGKVVISLGGGNDLAYPDCAGLRAATASGPIMALNIDTHFDVREDQPRNSGTPYRMLLDEQIIQPAHFWELGHQRFAVAAAHRAYLDQCGAHVVDLEQWRRRGISTLLESILQQQPNTPIFWGLDLDVVRAADAPGVSAPNPTGLSAEEICEVAQIAGANHHSRIFELTEVNPLYDLDFRTSRLAAILIWTFLAQRANW